MLAIHVPWDPRGTSYITHYSRIFCQGYALTGKTPKQIAKMVEDTRDISHSVGANVVCVCYDPSLKPDTLFEMWPSDIPEQAAKDFKWLKDNYEVPSSLCHLLDRKEIVIQYKDAVGKMTRDEVLTYVGPDKFEGGALWHPHSERKIYKELLYDIKKRVCHSPPLGCCAFYHSTHRR